MTTESPRKMSALSLVGGAVKLGVWKVKDGKKGILEINKILHEDTGGMTYFEQSGCRKRGLARNKTKELTAPTVPRVLS